MKLIGKYEVLAEIGTGSMGAIYRARDRVLDRVVALKLVRGQADLDPELKERFSREARACAKLSHPNIITVYDLGEAEDSLYIAMELLSGSDLRKLIQENRTPPLPVKLDVMAQVCDALQHAHQKQIVHRDIKPSNIFLCDDQRAKILDFGIARLPTSNLTIVGKVLGSPNYMAPEQIRGGICDSRSDLFSAAIVFWEFVARVHPFQAENIPAHIVGSPPGSLRSKDPAIPVELEALLLRALEKDPNERIQTAAELAAGLRTVIGRMTGNKTASALLSSLMSETASPHDLAEQSTSEFMSTVGDFEDSIGNSNTPAALEALVHMRGLAARDSRFSVALADCEVRFKKMVSGGANQPAPSRKSSDFKSPVKIGWGKNTIWVAAAGATVVLIGAGIWVRSRAAAGSESNAVVKAAEPPPPSLPPAPTIATATVAAATTSLLPAQTTIRPAIGTLRQGDTVNVIALPSSRDQEYTNVQVGGAAVGFVRTADLTSWSGVDSEAAWSLNRVFAPGETAGEADLLAQLEKWNQFTTKFPTAPQIAEAYLESARLNFALLKLAKGSGKSEVEWEPYLTRGREALGRAIGNPAIEAEVARLLHEFPASAPKTTVAAQTPEQILSRVYPLWEAGRYKDASRLVGQILAISPAHAKALAWKKKIRDSELAEAAQQ